MAIALTSEHRALAESVRGLVARDASHAALAAQGVLGVHVPEAAGGQGYGLVELAVTLEELGSALVAGPYLPTVLASAALTWSGRCGSLLPGLADGTVTATVVLDGHGLGAPDADLFLVPVAGGWALLDRTSVRASAIYGVDLSRPLSQVSPVGESADLPRMSPVGEGADLPRVSPVAGNADPPQMGPPAEGAADLSRVGPSGVWDVPASRVLGPVPVRELAAVLLGAEACGVAAWAVRTAADYAKVREQFGRPIGQFQGVKHRIAAALVALEQARAAVWDAARALDTARAHHTTARALDTTRAHHTTARALDTTRAHHAAASTPDAERAPHTADTAPDAGLPESTGGGRLGATDGGRLRADAERETVGRPPAGVPEAPGDGRALGAERAPGDGRPLGAETRLAVGVAAVLGPDAAVRCAADAIQVLGGIGYTFEHDAHRYYRRALSLRMLAGDPGVWAEQIAELAIGGARRAMEPDLPEEASPLREEIRSLAEGLAREEPLARLGRFAREGWIMPHLPEPWGRAATPLEQVIIHQEFHGLKRPNLGIAAWAVPSIVRYGTREQQERFLPKTFTGEIVWCQLFSEPGAGSDLAGLSTKAVRVEGGWSISGSKIWTSLAQYAHWGICLARTSPDRPKHDGITYFLVDMSSPGVTVRPLKEINGEEIFNEVFLDDVFVPDDLVVGEVDGGWRVARDTLSHERVALGDSWGPGSQHTDLMKLVRRLPPLRQAQLEQAGRLWAEGQAISALGLRVTLSQLAGTDAGTASSVRKLLGMRHAQAISEFCWSLAPADPYWNRMILTTRAFTIGGGTTEVQLNIIAERALGLPRDP
ncbi:acyl-CoA dehydrogenase family protein [Nonomuraea sp. NPDC059194]|uniref:acyl-CoA dehydrogenase n=1 Tax=Nonomuraea sp. NPDC059194 TaxID=3346764 RepID=UPI0036947F87